MISTVFVVFDAAAQAYIQPFFMATRGQAIRSFTDAANDPTHAFCQHPKDYTLFTLGQYDDANASFDLALTPEPMGNALEYKTQSEMPLSTPLRPAAPNTEPMFDKEPAT